MRKLNQELLYRIICVLFLIGFINLFLCGAILLFNKNVLIKCIGFILVILGIFLSGININIILEEKHWIPK